MRNFKRHREVGNALTIITLLLLSTISFGQKIVTGEYNFGLKLAYDNKTNKLTGYFENYTGLDEATNNPKFSCIFYIEGIIEGNIVKIKTYYPTDKLDDIIFGTLELANSKTVTIKLPEEHGGCWNVQHFADEPAKFTLEKDLAWVQIRFINADKTYFYSDKSTNKKQKSYLVKNNFVCIDKIEGDWAHCTFYGKKITKGWIKTEDLNKT
jgi:hypothetical protein